jgi:hypothetical protein
MSDQPPPTEVSYSSSSGIPLGAKVSYGIVAFIGFLGLVGCLGESLLDSSLVYANIAVQNIEHMIRPMLTLLLQHKADD